jgi:hypothetical protein
MHAKFAKTVIIILDDRVPKQQITTVNIPPTNLDPQIQNGFEDLKPLQSHYARSHFRNARYRMYGRRHLVLGHRRHRAPSRCKSP